MFDLILFEISQNTWEEQLVVLKMMNYPKTSFYVCDSVTFNIYNFLFRCCSWKKEVEFNIEGFWRADTTHNVKKLLTDCLLNTSFKLWLSSFGFPHDFFFFNISTCLWAISQINTWYKEFWVCFFFILFQNQNTTIRSGLHCVSDLRPDVSSFVLHSLQFEDVYQRWFCQTHAKRYFM